MSDLDTWAADAGRQLAATITALAADYNHHTGSTLNGYQRLNDSLECAAITATTLASHARVVDPQADEHPRQEHRQDHREDHQRFHDRDDYTVDNVRPSSW